MTKAIGVADAFVLDDLPKREMEGLLARMSSAVPTTETDMAGLARLLRLSLGDNRTSKISPPFKTAQVVETLGLGPVYPESLSLAELIEGLLADEPPQRKDAAALAQAHPQVAQHELADSWLEAGEDVGNLLRRFGRNWLLSAATSRPAGHSRKSR